jgi:alkaline phosphatase
MTVNYATNNFVSEEHTGVNVPLLSNSNGVGRIPAMLTQPEIFTIVKDYLFD